MPLPALLLLVLPGEDSPPVDFARDIRPLLADNCFQCHGPDEAVREADLRLDLRDEAFRDLGGYRAIVAGDADASELWLRISDSRDPMPPKKSGKSLSDDERELLRRWIDEGAAWEEHWAYRAPLRPPVPAPSDGSASPIDRFLLARMRAAGLEPEPEAPRETLVRRLALDLTGLPPSLELVDEFLADESPDAYERLVDRLLASPHYGEARARAWLDAARYGDTHGLHLDNERKIWPYRDWVIRAFDENMPFDRFTELQLAGDLTPEPTTEDLVATGFNRCNPTSAEGGMIAEEYLALYSADRAITTAAVWLGSTMLCAKCHDHKFDPISQRDFYSFAAFFGSIDEKASDENGFAPQPMVQVPHEADRAELARLDAAIAAKEAERDAPNAELDAAAERWRAEERARTAERWRPLELVAFDTQETELELLDDGSLLASGEVPANDVYEVLYRTEAEDLTALRIEALTHETIESGGIGRASHGNIVLSRVEVAVAPLSAPGRFEDVPLEHAVADYSQPGFHVRQVVDGDPQTGWAVSGRLEDHELWVAAAQPFGHAGGSLVRVRIAFESKKFPQHVLGCFRISASSEPGLVASTFGSWYLAGPFTAEDGDAAFDAVFGPEEGVVLEASYGEIEWVPRPDFVDGALHELAGEDASTYAYRTVQAPTERALTLGVGSDDAVQVWLNGELAHSNRVARSGALDQDVLELTLRPGENELLLEVVNYKGDYSFSARRLDEELGGLPLAVARALDDPDSSLPGDHYRRTRSPEWRALADAALALRAERDEYEAALPTSLVMRELEEPRPAHVLKRGAYDRPGAMVQPDTPAFLPPLGVHGRRATRLDLAQWLVRPGHPLTSRVAVNRFWQELFGTGLVETAEDFGSQGSWPSHPELLDWLALEFEQSGWDVKALIKRIVTSAAYRQRAATSPEKRALDPANRLLARGPRYRLEAERLRDSALAISGLLVETIGGPSVKPYQPAGIWKAVGYTSSNTAVFERDEGDALYRRSLYTFWKRTAPPPTMQLFDAPTREECVLRRARTNTPLQALALMNDVQFVEAARAFAERVLRVPGDDEARLVHAFRRATARRPDADELRVLANVLAGARDDYARSPEAAAQLIAVGASLPAEDLEPAELAAWTQVANLILNLDEVLNKE